jgi:hypothetical protein
LLRSFFPLLVLLILSPVLAVSNFTLNGQKYCSADPGDILLFEFDLEKPGSFFKAECYYDVNSNGKIDSTEDVRALDYDFFGLDGDIFDADDSINSTYKRYRPFTELSSPIKLPLLFEISDAGSADTASLVESNIITGQSLTASFTVPVEGLIVGIEQVRGVSSAAGISDSNGRFTIYVPDSLAWKKWKYSFKWLTTMVPRKNIGNYVIPMPDTQFYIIGHTQGNDLPVVEGTAWAQGALMDPVGNAVSTTARITVCFFNWTDQTVSMTNVVDGKYLIPMTAGTWRPLIRQFSPDTSYIIMKEVASTVTPVVGDTIKNLDLVCYPRDSWISGSVVLDTNPVSGIEIMVSYRAEKVVGYSDTAGRFQIRVTSLVDDSGGYTVKANPPDNFSIGPAQFNNVVSGTDTLLFNLQYRSGRISGFVYERESTVPVPGVRVEAHKSQRHDYGTFFIPTGQAITRTSGQFDIWVDLSLLDYYRLRLGDLGNAFAVTIDSHEVDSLQPNTLNNILYFMPVPARVVGQIQRPDIHENISFGVNSFCVDTLLLDTFVVNFKMISRSNKIGTFDQNLPFGVYDFVFELASTDSVFVETVVYEDIALDSAHDFVFLDIYPEWDIGVEAGTDLLPDRFSLLPNYPNPFNPVTHIHFTIPKKADAGADTDISIFNKQGRLVRTLIQGVMKPGKYKLRWDGRNGSGRMAGSGIYLVLMRSDNFQKTRKIVLMK